MTIVIAATKRPKVIKLVMVNVAATAPLLSQKVLLFKAWGVSVGGGSELNAGGAKMEGGRLKDVVGIMATGATTEVGTKDAESLVDEEVLDVRAAWWG
jgi:hypothetical protein